MSDSLKKFLIDLVISFVVSLGACWMVGAFGAETVLDRYRLLSDGFFVSAALFLGMGGLTWTYNGGVMDGLVYTFKNAVARIRRNYETEKMTFAEYREQREAKASSPKSMLLSGLVQLVIALAFFGLYNANL